MYLYIYTYIYQNAHRLRVEGRPNGTVSEVEVFDGRVVHQTRLHEREFSNDNLLVRIHSNIEMTLVDHESSNSLCIFFPRDTPGKLTGGIRKHF